MDYKSIPANDLAGICSDSNEKEAWSEFISRFQRIIALTILRTSRAWGHYSVALVADLVQETHSRGQPIPGYLNAKSISHLVLHNDLVVLSACNSGLGEQIAGEGTLGLGYAFLHAGVRQVISTLWSVDDDASSVLMADFYKEMLQEGKAPSSALRDSQLRMVRTKYKSHPFYWAGFSLTSEI